MTTAATPEDLAANLASVLDGLAAAARRATTVSEQALAVAADAVDHLETLDRTVEASRSPRVVALRGRLHEIDGRAATLTSLDEVSAALALLPSDLGLGGPVTTAAALADILGGCRFAYRDEEQLQAGIDAALTAANYEPRREVRLDARDRVDLLVDGVAIEVKLAGTTERLHEQLARYAAHRAVRELLVVTTRARHQTLPAVVGGKPCLVQRLGGAR